MIKVKSFRVNLAREDYLSQDLEAFFLNNFIKRENIIDIKYSTNNDWIYCMLIWEDK